MKNRVVPSQNEQIMQQNAFIVSKSDLQGRVTYCNRTLMQISGYSEPELLGKQHNILRHPDMPRTIFNLMWETIAAGKECFAYVKNLCKNGDYYWVFANITPDYDKENKICGYFSVRRKPKPEAIQEISKLYQQILEAEKQAGAKDAVVAGTKVLNDYLLAGNQNYETFILNI